MVSEEHATNCTRIIMLRPRVFRSSPSFHSLFFRGHTPYPQQLGRLLNSTAFHFRIGDVQRLFQSGRETTVESIEVSVDPFRSTSDALAPSQLLLLLLRL